MNRQNQSFFERLTGTVNLDDQGTNQQPDNQQQPQRPQQDSQSFGGEFADSDQYQAGDQSDEWQEPSQQEDTTGELAIDVYETPEHIIIQTMIAGVRPEEVDVSITRDQCTISGRREGPRDVPAEDYHLQELYWGAFQRSVVLPEEIEVDGAEANENHGLLTITLPKINKDRETKLEVQSS